MTEPETKIRNLMDDLAREARLDPRLERPTLRRARRRRVAGPAVALVLAVAVGLAGFETVHVLRTRSGPAGGVRPTPVPAPSASAASPAPVQSPASPAPEPSASSFTGPSASPEPSTAFASDVADGRYIAYVKQVDAGADPATVLFDRAVFLTGDAANRYARDHGLETPVPNDNLIVNDNPLLRLMPLAADVEIDVIDYRRCSSACERLDVAAFADLMTMPKPFADGVHMGPTAPYWLTIRGGTVVKIEEQFQV